MTSGCAHPGRVWVCGRSAGRSDSCASKEPPSLLARQLATTWNTVWSHIKPCLQAASDDPARFAGVQVLGVDERRVASPGLTPPGPRELTGIVDLTRGKDHPTARLLDLVPGRSGTVYKNWLAERGKDFRAGVRIATLDPLPGTARTPLTTRTKTQPACSTPFVWSSSPATPQVRCVAASSKTPWVTAHAQAIPSIKSGFFCAPHTRRLTPRQQERLREAFVADEAHISVDVAYLHRTSARRLPPRHTRPRPTPGGSSHPAPTSLSHPRNRSPGPDPTQVEGRILGLLRHRRSQQRANRSHQRTLSNWADAPPEATPTPPTTNSEYSSSQEA